MPAEWDDDRPLPEDAAIAEAFPTRSERHDLYAEAMRLVGAKRSKGALVALVNWLLNENAKLQAERDEARSNVKAAESCGRISGARDCFDQIKRLAESGTITDVQLEAIDGPDWLQNIRDIGAPPKAKEGA